MFSLTRNLCLTMAAAVALAILTAGVPASSDERVVNLGPHASARSSVLSPTRPSMA